MTVPDPNQTGDPARTQEVAPNRSIEPALTQASPSPSPDSTGTRAATPDQHLRSAEEYSQTHSTPAHADRYELRGVLAKGGMGAVHRAWDAVLSRDVAVKSLHESLGGSNSARARFDYEAMITGQLQHPNIPPIYDLGTLPNGIPYLAMKLIKGETLDAHLKQQTDPREGLGRFLAVFEGICQAVGYAHAQGIIHRDLKPLNVMVGAFGEVQVMDWGLAKKLGANQTDPDAGASTEPLPADAAKTVAGAAIGTPSYMPPEQAVGALERIDERSDVFGLGGILCAILTGKPPFVGPTGESTRQLAARGAVADAYARIEASGAESELIALAKRCLAVEPGDRFANGEEVASAVARLRADAETRARQAELDRRAGEVRAEGERKRRRTMLIAAGALAAVLLVGIVGTTLGLIEARDQKGHAEQETGRANEALILQQAETEAKNKALLLAQAETAAKEKARKLAEDRLDQTRRTLDNLLDQFGDQKLSGLPGTQEIRQVLFARGVEQVEQLYRENPNNRAVLEDLTNRLVQLGRLQSEIGTLDSALAPLKKADALQRERLTRDPKDPDARYRVAVIQYEIGYCHWEHKEPEPGKPFLREAIQMLTALREEKPDAFDVRLYQAMAQTRLAALDTRTPEAIKLQEEAAATLKKLLEENPKHPKVLNTVARVTNNRGVSLSGQGKYPEAIALFEETRTLAARAIAVEPYEPNNFTILRFATLGLSGIYGKTNRVNEGIKLLTEAIDDLSKQATANPAVALYPQALYYLHDELRILYRRANNPDAATHSLQEMIRIADALGSRNPRNAQYAVDYTFATLELADFHKARNKETEATGLLDRLIRQSDQLVKLHPTNATLLGNLLHAHTNRGELSSRIEQYDVARKSYQNGVDLYRRSIDRVAKPTEAVYRNAQQCVQGLLDVVRKQEDKEAALTIGQTLVPLFRSDMFATVEWKQDFYRMRTSAAQALEDVGRVDEAIKLFAASVAELRKTADVYPPNSPGVSHHHLARMYRKVNDREGEFRALRDYFEESRPYLDGSRRDDLLKETEKLTDETLKRLRTEFDNGLAKGAMKRFTIPVEFDGVKYPFFVYVTGNWQFTEDQFIWVEKVRGAKVPPEVRTSFAKLAKVATENNVSFHDLCVYALGTAAAEKLPNVPNNTPLATTGRPKLDLIVAMREVEVLKKNAGVPGQDIAALKKQIGLKYLQMAEDEIVSANYFRAGHLVAETAQYLDLDTFGKLRDESNRDLFASYQFVNGCLLAGTGEHAKGYALIFESRKTMPLKPSPGFALTGGKREFALGWTCDKLNRSVESATWYRQALDAEHPLAARALFRVLERTVNIVQTLPSDLTGAYFEARKVATAAEPGDAAFARLVAERKLTTSRQTALERNRQALLESIKKVEADPKDAILRRGLASSYETVGENLALLNTFGEAAYYFQKGVAIREELANAPGVASSAKRELARVQVRLGSVFVRAGELAKGKASYDAGLATSAKMVEESPLLFALHQDHLVNLYLLGLAYETAGDDAEAIRWFEKSLAVAERYSNPKAFTADVTVVKQRLTDAQQRLAKKPRPLAPPPREVKRP